MVSSFRGLARNLLRVTREGLVLGGVWGRSPTKLETNADFQLQRGTCPPLATPLNCLSNISDNICHTTVPVLNACKRHAYNSTSTFINMTHSVTIEFHPTFWFLCCCWAVKSNSNLHLLFTVTLHWSQNFTTTIGGTGHKNSEVNIPSSSPYPFPFLSFLLLPLTTPNPSFWNQKAGPKSHSSCCCSSCCYPFSKKSLRLS